MKQKSLPLYPKPQECFYARNKSQCFKANFDRSSRTSRWGKRSWNFCIFLPQTIIYCMQNPADCTSPLSLAISDSQYPSVCQCVSPNNFTVNTKWIVFCSISKCLQKPDIKGSGFTIWGPAFSCFSMSFLFCALWWWRCLNLRGTLLIHTNDCPLFDVIENACTSCWEERKKK